jgi:SEC-C motif
VLNSADEVPFFRFVDGRYEECGRIRRSDFRVMVPIGLTVESFSPFSTYCKSLPQVKPLLGKHAFVSMSIDELFVLRRFLPTPGVFAHYIEVRQSVAGMQHAHLFDEFDHLGAYITKNRFDQEIAGQLKDGKTDMLVWDGMSNIIDKSFASEDWETRPIPAQEFPNEVLELLEALDATRARGWLSAESHIRDFDEQARKNLAKILSDLGKTLVQHPARYFTIQSEGKPLFVWMQSTGSDLEWKRINDKASAAALCTKSPDIVGLLLEVGADGKYTKAQRFAVHVPSNRMDENAHIYDDAERMSQPSRKLDIRPAAASLKPKRVAKTGRNQTCPCGSGVKYKRCHGR